MQVRRRWWAERWCVPLASELPYVGMRGVAATLPLVPHNARRWSAAAAVTMAGAGHHCWFWCHCSATWLAQPCFALPWLPQRTRSASCLPARALHQPAFPAARRVWHWPVTRSVLTWCCDSWCRSAGAEHKGGARHAPLRYDAGAFLRWGLSVFCGSHY